MTTRRRFSEREVIETLIRQGAIITCYRCKLSFFPVDCRTGEVQREHLLEVAIGGGETPTNCVYSHKACHAVITDGTPATTAGSSKQRIAKVRAISGGKMAVKKQLGKKKLTAWTKRVRAWPKGRVMQSKGFVKI